jgi:hypothetical protein
MTLARHTRRREPGTPSQEGRAALDPEECRPSPSEKRKILPVKAKIIFSSLELQQLNKALHRAANVGPRGEEGLTFGFDVEIEIETPIAAAERAVVERTMREIKGALCPKCGYGGTHVGNLGLVACETAACRVVLFRGAA